MSSNRKKWQGVVVGDKIPQTLVVEVPRRFPHPKYQKVIERTSTFYVHDPKREGKVGELVEFIESRPISKTKRWKLVRILKVTAHRDVADLGDVPEEVLRAKKKQEEASLKSPEEVAPTGDTGDTAGE